MKLKRFAAQSVLFVARMAGHLPSLVARQVVTRSHQALLQNLVENFIAARLIWEKGFVAIHLRWSCGVVRGLSLQEPSFAGYIPAPLQCINPVGLEIEIVRISDRHTHGTIRLQFPANAEIVQLSAHPHQFCAIFNGEVEGSAKNPPLCCQQSKCHLDANPQLGKVEVVGSAKLEIPQGSSHLRSGEWNKNFQGQSVGVIGDGIVILCQCIESVQQVGATVKRPQIIGFARRSDGDILKDEIRVAHRLDVQSIALVVPAEIVPVVWNNWRLSVKKPPINGSKVALKKAKY